MITQLNSFGVTDIGRFRESNEDQYLLSELHQPIVADLTHSTACDSLVTDQTLLLAVADGIGGQQGGAIASELAVDSLGCFAQENESRIRNADEPWRLANLVRKGILRAHEQIEKLASSHSSKHGMATTLTAALIRYPDLVIGHVGDSRCYLFRDGKLQRLTKDHTMAELYREQNNLTVSDRNSRMSHVLWNCLGGHNVKADVESHVVTLRPDDWVLLATDGLTRHVDDYEIQHSIFENESPRELCTMLKSMAIQRGGKDNVTIVACNWETPSCPTKNMVASVSKSLSSRETDASQV